MNCFPNLCSGNNELGHCVRSLSGSPLAGCLARTHRTRLGPIERLQSEARLATTNLDFVLCFYCYCRRAAAAAAAAAALCCTRYSLSLSLCLSLSCSRCKSLAATPAVKIMTPPPSDAPNLLSAIAQKVLNLQRRR